MSNSLNPSLWQEEPLESETPASPASPVLQRVDPSLQTLARRALARRERLAKPVDWINDLPQFEEVDLEYDPHDKILWQFQKFTRRPSVTLELLRDIRQVLELVEASHNRLESGAEPPVKYLVSASRLPGIFNLGGDLPRFAECIRNQDRDGLRRYAYTCIDVQYRRTTKMEVPFQSISLVQGDALGGGFEAALTDDVIIAERSAKLALPEILFNLFPGMGGYTLLCRRLNAVTAEKLILSGRIYTAEEMHELGVVDYLAEDGAGVDAVHDYVARNERSFWARQSVYRARQITRPVSWQELKEITDLWIDAAMRVHPQDVRKMERLAAAQDRLWTRSRRRSQNRAEPGSESAQA